MKTAAAFLRSESPYSQSKFYEVEKLEKESHADYEVRTWRERMHYNKAGNVLIPPMQFKNCMSEVAKYTSEKIKGKGNATFTKHFVSGVLCTEPLVLPEKKDEVEGEWLFVPSDGVRGSGSRVKKCFPIIREWEGEVTFLILDEIITKDAFEKHLREAGQFIGVGRFRPRNNGYYGRFSVESIKWS